MVCNKSIPVPCPPCKPATNFVKAKAVYESRLSDFLEYSKITRDRLIDIKYLGAVGNSESKVYRYLVIYD